MKRNRSLILLIALTAAIVAGFIYYRTTYLPKYAWWHTYRPQGDQPYDLGLFNKVLKKKASKIIPVYHMDYAALDTASKGNLVFVGEEYWTDSLNAAIVRRYMERGGTVFIASEYAPLEILSTFVPVGDSIMGYSWRRDSLLTLRFNRSDLPYRGALHFHHQNLKDTTSTDWGYYRSSYLNDTLSQWGFTAQSELEGVGINSFYVERGKGRIIVHSNPLLFTNYYLRQPEGYLHLNNFLAQLDNGPVYLSRPYTKENAPDEEKHSNNPLRFVFSHAYLKWGWYTFLVAVLLYLIFRSKREQRVIAMSPQNNNTTIAYAKAIGSLYFRKQAHQTIVHDMQLLFLADVRQRYHMATDVAEEQLINQLQARSGISKSALQGLFRQFRELNKAEGVSEDQLIRLYETIDYYNKKRK